MNFSFWRRVLSSAATTAAIVVTNGVSSPAQQKPQTAPRTHALLIGVTHYPNLAKAHQLTGPQNDVRLMRDTLVKRFGVDRGRIMELAGWPANTAQRPTRANILAALDRLADPNVVATGDQAMIMFAGHGSQEPDTDNDEEDQLDEIFLPADAGNWDGGTGHVLNAIRDDEIGQKLEAIRKRGVFVWIVFDACQSSTLTRGGYEVQRLVPMTALVPQAVLDKLKVSTQAEPRAESAIVGLRGDVGGIAALYAAQTIEPTPEKALPDAKGPVHGLFTYTIVEVLQQRATAITYRDLAERVIDRYRAMGRIGPTPGFEGGGLDTTVLGTTVWSGPRLLVGEADPKKGLQLRAGSVAGLTTGTVVAIYPPAGSPNPDRVVGHVRVTEVDPISATIQPVAFDKMPAPDPSKIVIDSRGEVVLFDYGEQVLRVAAAPKSPPLVEQALAAIRTHTNGLAEPAPLASAEWIVHVAGGNVILAPASGWQEGAANVSGALQVAAASAPDVTAKLAETLQRISRARNLMRLGAAAEPVAVDAEVDVEVELVRYKDDQDRIGTAVPLEQGGRVLRVGEIVGFRVKNVGTATADVTLLFVDSRFGIDPVFPRADVEAENRLKPGEERRSVRFDVHPKTTGPEQVVAIAVGAGQNAPRVDFRYLAQPTLDAAPPTTHDTRGMRAGTRGGAAGGLQRLLDRAMFGQGQTRSLAGPEVGRHAVKMLAWTTVK